jgi:hypothetical protein
VSAENLAGSGSAYPVTMRPKARTVCLSGACSHGRSIDYFIKSIIVEDAYPSVGCLTEEDANSGSCTENSSAFMGEKIRFT